MRDTPMTEIAKRLKRQACEEIEVLPGGDDRFQVITPLAYDDGDLLPIILKRDNGGWILTDEGRSFMHLAYAVDEEEFFRDPRQAIIRRTLSAFQIENRRGELVLPINEDRYAEALYAFIHALLKIDDIRFLSRDRAAPTFYAEFRNFVETRVAPERLQRKWHHQQKDSAGLYVADYRINGRPRPLYLFGMASPDKVNVATIALHQYEDWGISGDAVGVFDNPERIPKRVQQRFTDVGARVFSSLGVAEERIGHEFPDVFLPAPVHPE